MIGKQYRELICGSGKRKSFSNQIDSLYSKIQQKFLNKPAFISAPPPPQKKKKKKLVLIKIKTLMTPSQAL